MPLIAFALQFKAAYDQIQKEVDRVTRRELREKAKAVLGEARSIWRKSGSPISSLTNVGKRDAHGRFLKATRVTSQGGEAPVSRRGVTKKLLGMRIGKRSAFVGYRKGKAGKNQKGAARAVPNILEHGSRKMDPRPVLEPALERVKSHPFKGVL
jgi:hypothetical protein